MSIYGTSAVRRLSRLQAAELDDRLLSIAYEEHPTSVRGMYYMAIGADLVDKDSQNKRNNYMRVQRRLLAMRRDGRLPYGWITDGSRTIYGHTRYDDPTQFARSVAGRYRKDYWVDSPARVEVWVEKDAMAGKLRPVVVEESGLDLYVSRGFASETYLQEAGAYIQADGRPTYVYLLTDFDASGMNIAETVERELTKHAHPTEVVVQRVAATAKQIEEYGLITQPVTHTDSRARRFVQRYGNETVELDAIPATAIRQLVRESVERHMDSRRLEVLRMVEEEERTGLIEMFGGAA
jgi:hypothetical protein